MGRQGKMLQWTEAFRFPTADLTDLLGPIGELDTESKALLIDCGVDADEFDAEVVACLPSIVSSSTNISRLCLLNV